MTKDITGTVRCAKCVAMFPKSWIDQKKGFHICGRYFCSNYCLTKFLAEQDKADPLVAHSMHD